MIFSSIQFTEQTLAQLTTNIRAGVYDSKLEELPIVVLTSDKSFVRINRDKTVTQIAVTLADFDAAMTQVNDQLGDVSASLQHIEARQQSYITTGGDLDEANTV